MDTGFPSGKAYPLVSETSVTTLQGWARFSQVYELHRVIHRGQQARSRGRDRVRYLRQRDGGRDRGEHVSVRSAFVLGVILFAAILVYGLFRIPVSVNESRNYAPGAKALAENGPGGRSPARNSRKKSRPYGKFENGLLYIYSIQGVLVSIVKAHFLLTPCIDPLSRYMNWLFIGSDKTHSDAVSPTHSK